MLPYVLTEDAEQDLREVARYTLNRWGKEILQQYRNGLKETFKAIAANSFPSQPYPLIVCKPKSSSSELGFQYPVLFND